MYLAGLLKPFILKKITMIIIIPLYLTRVKLIITDDSVVIINK